MSESLLRSVPLFESVGLEQLAELMTSRDLAPGDHLWRQGEPADGLHVIESGRVQVAVRLPGGRESALAELQPGNVVGELALLGGGPRTASVRALEPTRVLGLAARDFHAIALSRDAGAMQLRRRLLLLACERLARRHRALGESLSGDRVRLSAGEEAERVAAPGHDYLLRLGFFGEHDAVQLSRLIDAAEIRRVARGAVLIAEGEPPPACLITLNGAVEEVIRRAGGAIRVALAGPGRAFGYAGLVTGGAATATAVARERSVLLAIEPAALADQIAHDPFARALERDVVASLRQAERPQARLAARGLSA